MASGAGTDSYRWRARVQQGAVAHMKSAAGVAPPYVASSAPQHPQHQQQPPLAAQQPQGAPMAMHAPGHGGPVQILYAQPPGEPHHAGLSQQPPQYVSQQPAYMSQPPGSGQPAVQYVLPNGQLVSQPPGGGGYGGALGYAPAGAQHRRA
jgi:hypothetical protein